MYTYTHITYTRVYAHIYVHVKNSDHFYKIARIMRNHLPEYHCYKSDNQSGMPTAFPQENGIQRQNYLPPAFHLPLQLFHMFFLR